MTAARAAGSDSPVIVRPPDDPGHIGSDDVRVPFGVRVRSAALLTVAVIGAAILVGVVLAIVVVGAVLLVA